MKRERSSSTSEGDLTRLTSLRRVAPASSSESLTPAAERSLREARTAEIRELCRPLTLADLIAEIERRCEEEAGDTSTALEAPVGATGPRSRTARRGQHGRTRGRQGEGTSRQGARNPPPPPPVRPRAPRMSSPRDVPPPPPSPFASRRRPGTRCITAGELGELPLPHRFLVDPELPGHVVGRRTAELLGLRVHLMHGPPPPGFGIEVRVVRPDGEVSEVVGYASARVKLGFETHILQFMVVSEKVETRLGREVMGPFRLSIDRVNGVLHQAETTRIGIPDPRV